MDNQKLIAGNVFLNSVELADYLRVTVQAVRMWRCKGRGPRFVKIGSKVYYRPADVEAWLQSRTVASTSELRASKE